MQLIDLLDEERICVDLQAASKDEALRKVAERLVRGFEGEKLNIDTVESALRAREELGSTGAGSGIALPHGRIYGDFPVRAAFFHHRRGIPFDSIDEQPVTLIIGLLSPDGAPAEHLRALASISRALRTPEITKALRESESAQAVLHALRWSPEPQSN